MPTIKNGVNLDDIQQYVSGVKANPELGKVKFVAKSNWAGGTRANVTVSDIFAGGQSATPGRSFSMKIDEPSPLGGTDEGPNPAEMLAVALCGCLTAAIATNAALFDTELSDIDVEVELDWDMHGLLGLDRSVPNGAAGLHYKVRLNGPGDKAAMQRAKETIDRKSAVLNTLLNGVKVTTETIIG